MVWAGQSPHTRCSHSFHPFRQAGPLHSQHSLLSNGRGTENRRKRGGPTAPHAVHMSLSCLTSIPHHHAAEPQFCPVRTFAPRATTPGVDPGRQTCISFALRACCARICARHLCCRQADRLRAAAALRRTAGRAAGRPAAALYAAPPYTCQHASAALPTDIATPGGAYIPQRGHGAWPASW